MKAVTFVFKLACTMVNATFKMENQSQQNAMLRELMDSDMLVTTNSYCTPKKMGDAPMTSRDLIPQYV